jgi:hypothetical protein
MIHQLAVTLSFLHLELCGALRSLPWSSVCTGVSAGVISHRVSKGARPLGDCVLGNRLLRKALSS